MTHDEKVKKYCDNKFGIFMHWGPFSGNSLEDFDYVNTKQEDFKPYIDKFNEATKNFSVEEWFDTFEKVGARYFSFVIRHPFNLYYNMYKSQVMNFCSERDFVGEINESCQKHNIDFIAYQPLDSEGHHKWQKEGYPNYQVEAKRRYDLIKERLAEVVDRYNPFGVWLDGWPGAKIALENAGKDPFEFYDFEELASIARKNDETTLVGNKEYFTPYIDYICSEQFLCDHFGNPISGNKVPTEVNETLPASLIFFVNKDADKMEMSKEELDYQKTLFVKRFFSIVGRGMNYLLNIGPMLNGKIPDIDLAILNYLGEWVNRYSEAIYETRYCDDSYDWGYMVKKGDTKYLYVMDNANIVDAKTCHRDYTGRGFRERAENTQREAPKWQKIGVVKGISFTCDNEVKNIVLLNKNANVAFTYNNGIVNINCNELKSDDEVLILKVE